jgi:uncharacterized Fe-S cluster protein YjdI
MTHEHLARMLLSTWGIETLSDFENKAEAQFNGTYVSVAREPSTGRIVAVAACLTGEHEISKLLTWFPSLKSGPSSIVDWSSVKVLDMVIRSCHSGAIGYEMKRTSVSGLTSIVLTAADPDSITIFSRFGFIP